MAEETKIKLDLTDAQKFYDKEVVYKSKAINKIYSRVNNGQQLTQEDEEELGNLYASFCMYG